MTTIRRCESDPTARRLLFMITDQDGRTPMIGATVSQVMISPNGEHWRASRGTVVESGHGWYYFTPTRDEIDFVGSLAVDIPGWYTPLAGIHLHATIMPSTEVDDPPVYFTTTPPPRNALDDLGYSWGINRHPGESDQAFRQRIRAVLGNTQRGTLEDLRASVNAVENVVRVREIETPIAGTIVVRVVTEYAHQSIRDEIERAIDTVRPAGIVVDLELETPNGMAWA